MDTLRNVICSRWERRPLVGLAHLWLRHLPVSFVYRMACLNMEWRDARDALLDRRGGLDVLLDALAAGGEEASWRRRGWRSTPTSTRGHRR